MKVIRNTDAGVNPLKFTTVQDHLRVDSDADEILLTEYINSAREQFERDTDFIVTNQTYTIYLDSFPSNQIIVLPIQNVRLITSVKYYDEDGVLQTLDSSLYNTDLIDRNARIVAVQDDYYPDTELQRPNAVEIALSAGYTDPVGSCPADIKQALMMLIGAWYAHRETVTPLAMNTVPTGYERIIQRYRQYNASR